MPTQIPLPKGTIDETGHTYGRLTVRGFAGIEDSGGALWLCRCECGGEITTRGKRLRNGRTVSCGCYRADPNVRKAARLKIPARRRKAIARMGGNARKSDKT